MTEGHCYYTSCAGRFFQFDGDSSKIPEWVYERLKSISHGDGSVCGDIIFELQIRDDHLLISEYQICGWHHKRTLKRREKCEIGDYILEKHPDYWDFGIGVATKEDFEKEFTVIK